MRRPSLCLLLLPLLLASARGEGWDGRELRFGDGTAGRLEVTSRGEPLRRICNDTVHQEAGYYKVRGSKDLNMFYWFFESRSDPSTDPLILWMTGGPGCSDATALFQENGPCLLPKGSKWPVRNEFGWNDKASILYIDQPCGVGFSYGDAEDSDVDESGVAKHVSRFLKAFLLHHPEKIENPLFIFGESYGGHYVPAVAAAVLTNSSLNLQGVGIGNGLTVPLIQYEYYPELSYTYAKDKLGEPVIPGWQYALQKAGWPSCQKRISTCQDSVGSCQSAEMFCNAMMLTPYQLSGKNPYDIRLECEVRPLCYDFSNMDPFMNDPVVKDALGVPEDIQWQDCNFTVNEMFSSDWMRDFDEPIKLLLSKGIDVLIYAGDMDFICNWIGNKAWTLALEWPGKEEFNAAEDAPVSFGGAGPSVGEARQAQGLTFLRVYDAGHLAPMDQPKATLEMVNWFTGKHAGPPHVAF